MASVFLIFAASMTGNIFRAHPRVLALGDSYTIGESVETSGRWPVQMLHLLKKQGINLGEPQIIAKTGWTTDELQAGIAQATVQDRYEWVTLLIGVNNQYRKRDVESFRKDFQSLLEFAIEKADHRPERVLVLSIPDWGVTPFAEGRDRAEIAQQIDRYNEVKREETERLHAHFIRYNGYYTRSQRQAPGTASERRIASIGRNVLAMGGTGCKNHCRPTKNPNR